MHFIHLLTNMTSKQDIVYFGYARKSSESKERQVQSIEDQTTVLEGMAKQYGLRMKEIITESRSAFVPFKREAFNDMIRRIKKGEAQGIITWKLDRLARNPDEAGMILGMLQRGEIKHIRTFEREFLPEDNALISFLEFGIANQSSRDLGPNVKRGLKSKLEKGWRPGSCPHGYINTKTRNRGENTNEQDPERFDDIKEAWNKLLTGNLTPIQILNWLTHERGFLTRKTALTGGKPLTRSSIYRIFTNIFYAGWFEYGGELYQGKHVPMITLEEFDRAQVILGKRGKPRVQINQYAYTGVIKCERGHGVIATNQKKKLKDGSIRRYVLYFCEHCRKAKEKGSVTRALNVDLIEEAIDKELERLTIPPEFLDWALDIIEEKADEANLDKKRAIESLQKAYDANQDKLDRLLEGYSRGVIDDNDFLQQKNRIKGEMGRLSERIAKHREENPEWLELTRKTFEFATYARAAFMRGDAKTRREILLGLADLNCTMIGKEFSIQAMPWFLPIQELKIPTSPVFEALEPETPRTQTTKDAFRRPSVLMRGRRDLNPQPPA